MSKKIILFDIDGTLADSSHRANSESIDAVSRDAPIESMCELCRTLSSCDAYEVVILTARLERLREVTAKWLSKQGIRYSSLIMRKSVKTSPQAFKREAVRKLKMSSTVALSVDDDYSNVCVYTALGVDGLAFYAKSKKGN